MGGGGAKPGCPGHQRLLLFSRESSSNVRALDFVSEALRSVIGLSVSPFPSTPASLAAVLTLLLGGEIRDKCILCKDVAAAPLVPGHLQEKVCGHL